jgi:CRP-like cAMP-binding protein
VRRRSSKSQVRSHNTRILSQSNGGWGRREHMGQKMLPLGLRKKLQSIGRPERKQKGTVLFRSGQPCRGAFLIRSGRVELSLEGASHLYPARVLKPGAVIGLPAIFSGEPYSLTAQTKTACRLDFIPRAELLDLLRRNPRAGFEIIRVLSEEISLMRTVAKRSLQTRESILTNHP